MQALFIIFSFVIIMGSIALGVGSAIHRRQVEYKERKEALDREAAQGANAGSTGQVAKLEERVRVLERLATDRPGITSASLADEIENLRAESPTLADHREQEEQTWTGR